MTAWQPGYGKSKPKAHASAASAAPRAMQGKKRKSPLREWEMRERRKNGFGQEGGFSGRRGAFRKRK